MVGNILTALAAALVCTVILWLIREMMMCPIKAGKNTRQQIVLEVCGPEPALENHLRSLLWLIESGTLNCRIIIYGTELDEETRFIAKAMEVDNDCISFYENGEIPHGSGFGTFRAERYD